MVQRQFISLRILNADTKANALEGAGTHINGAINRMLRRIGQVAVPIVKAETPRGATGHLRNYTVFQVIGGPTAQRMEVRQSARSRGGFFYGVAVRRGTRPHFPPVDDLIPWVITVLGVAPDRARLVAFLVARKISRAGTRPNRYDRRAMRLLRPHISRIAAEESQRLAAELNP